MKPHQPMPLFWWHEQHEKIDTDPSYQRRPNLWNTNKQAFLIDSILNDYDMPKIYLADFTSVITTLNEKKKPYAIIDGKQRLQAIFKFFGGTLRLNRDFIYQSDPSLKLAGLNYQDLKIRYPEVAEKFSSHLPSVMSVVTDEEGKIEELFLRLNTGVHVSGAERRNAMKGIVPIIIRRLVKKKFFTSNIKFNVDRMADHNAAAKVLLIEYTGEFADTFATNLDAFVRKGIKGEEASFKKAERRVVKGLNDMSTVFIKEDPLLASAGPIPVYYWFVKHHLRSKAYIREFLSEFVKAVQKNQHIVKDNPDEGDPELSHYYTMMRTTNEKRSLEARYKILESRFTKFLRRKKRKK
ncbi:MAG TPA: DUF262 domain-containing protein [Pyrinomonadaceae bacterium]